MGCSEAPTDAAIPCVEGMAGAALGWVSWCDSVPLLKLLGSALLKHRLTMEFVAVKLKIIASLGGLCGDCQRGWNMCKKSMQ